MMVPPHELSSISWKSATLKYLGPQKDFAVNGTAVIIDDVCKSTKKWLPVQGKIVVFSFASRTCSTDYVYKQIQKANAIAAVESSPFDPPDFNTMVHASWDRCRFCQDPIPFVRVTDLKQMLPHLLVRHEDSEVVLQIKSPHMTSMKELYASTQWLVVLRIIIPTYAFVTAAMAGYEIYRETKSASFKARGPYSVRFVICALETPTLRV